MGIESTRDDIQKALKGKRLPGLEGILHKFKMFGMSIFLGIPSLPDDRYPEWSLRQILFVGKQTEVEGWIFNIEKNGRTPVGLVTGLSSQRKDDTSFEDEEMVYEWVVKGWGWVVIQEPGLEARFVEVSADVPKVLIYGKGTTVAYIAGDRGLVGVSIGIPAGIEEVNLALEDEKVSAKVRGVYFSFYDWN